MAGYRGAGPLTEVPEPEEPSESLLSGIEGISGTFSSFTVTAEEADWPPADTVITA